MSQITFRFATTKILLTTIFRSGYVLVNWIVWSSKLQLYKFLYKSFHQSFLQTHYIQNPFPSELLITIHPIQPISLIIVGFATDAFITDQITHHVTRTHQPEKPICVFVPMFSEPSDSTLRMSVNLLCLLSTIIGNGWFLWGAMQIHGLDKFFINNSWLQNTAAVCPPRSQILIQSSNNCFLF